MKTPPSIVLCKALFPLIAAAGLIACGTIGVKAQELLVAPGMNSIGPNGQLGNTPNPPWVLKAQRGANLAFDDGASSEPWADVDGGGFGIFFKAFIGNPPWDPTAGNVDVNIYQDVLGTPGTQYRLTGWWGAEDNWSGFNTAGANALFGLQFLNGSGGLISSTLLDLEAAGLGNPAAPGLNYEQFAVMATAPAGTVSVRAIGSMVDGVFFQDPGQALVTDSWSLTVVPEPATVALVGIGLLAVVCARRRS